MRPLLPLLRLPPVRQQRLRPPAIPLSLQRLRLPCSRGQARHGRLRSNVVPGGRDSGAGGRAGAPAEVAAAASSVVALVVPAVEKLVGLLGPTPGPRCPCVLRARVLALLSSCRWPRLLPPLPSRSLVRPRAGLLLIPRLPLLLILLLVLALLLPMPLPPLLRQLFLVLSLRPHAQLPLPALLLVILP